MLIQKIKAVFKGIPLEEQLLLEKNRLLKELTLIEKYQNLNFLTRIRDDYGFGRLKRSLSNYTFFIIFAVLGYYLTGKVAFVQGILSLPFLALVIGIGLHIKYPVSKIYLLGEE